MSATISIDTGGTFTDGYFTRDGAVGRVKVDTTPHDLTECLAKCIEAGASALGYPDSTGLLLDCSAIRFSSTIGTNSIIQRTGPRIGLVVSAGAGGTLYSDGASPLFDFMVDRSLVVELSDPHDEAHVRERVRQLLIGGPRIIVVSLEDSDSDPSGEANVKRIVQRDYPRHYLGSVPCLLASEVTPLSGAERRTATTVVNAYLHTDMVRVLYKADEDLRNMGAVRPLLIVHSSGAVARVAKTKAIETYNSGPVGGVHGSARMAQMYGLPAVVTIDVGGTSTDAALIVNGAVPSDPNPMVAGIPVYSPMVRVNAVGGGGGSIARLANGRYTVGPDSVGASPGPACYALGGTLPTATDAEVTLGHIDPNWFLAGRRKLDASRARSAIEKIAEGRDVDEVAWQIHSALVDIAADAVSTSLSEGRISPSDVVLFAFGGGGGLYSADVARKLGIPRVLCFEASSVFSAAGISGMDVGHVYEIVVDAAIVERLAEVRTRAELDARGEGFDPSSIMLEIEFDTPNGAVSQPVGPSAPVVPAGATSARVRAMLSLERFQRAPYAVGSSDPSEALKGERPVARPGGRVTARVYDREKLRAGHVVTGVALIEAVDTTIVVPEGAQLTIDAHGNATLEFAHV